MSMTNMRLESSVMSSRMSIDKEHSVALVSLRRQQRQPMTDHWVTKQYLTPDPLYLAAPLISLFSGAQVFVYHLAVGCMQRGLD